MLKKDFYVFVAKFQNNQTLKKYIYYMQLDTILFKLNMITCEMIKIYLLII